VKNFLGGKSKEREIQLGAVEYLYPKEKSSRSKGESQIIWRKLRTDVHPMYGFQFIPFIQDMLSINVTALKGWPVFLGEIPQPFSYRAAITWQFVNM
jgi:hypothetical protein